MLNPDLKLNLPISIHDRFTIGIKEIVDPRFCKSRYAGYKIGTKIL